MANLLFLYVTALWANWWAVVTGSFPLLLDQVVLRLASEKWRNWSDERGPWRRRIEVGFLVVGIVWAGFAAWEEEHRRAEDLAASINGKGGYIEQVATLNGQISTLKAQLAQAPAPKSQPPIILQVPPPPTAPSTPLPHATIGITHFNIIPNPDNPASPVVNFYLNNSGSTSGDNPAREFTYRVVDTPLSDDDIDKIMRMVTAAAPAAYASVKQHKNAQIEAGSNVNFFSEYLPMGTADAADAVLKRQKIVYAFVALAYRDDNLPPGQFWITESCLAIQLNGVMQMCGDNNKTMLHK